MRKGVTKISCAIGYTGKEVLRMARLIVNQKVAVTTYWHCPKCKQGNVRVTPEAINAVKCERCGQVLFRWLGTSEWLTEEAAAAQLEQPGFIDSCLGN